MNINPTTLLAEAEAEVNKLPRLSSPGNASVSGRAQGVLVRASEQAGKLTDEYVSTEHLLLAMLDPKLGGGAERIFRAHGVMRDKVLGAVVDSTGSVVAVDRRPTEGHDVRAVEDTIVDLVAGFAQEYDVAAVGIGAAGFVDVTRTVVMFSPHLDWRREPLRARVASVPCTSRSSSRQKTTP